MKLKTLVIALVAALSSSAGAYAHHSSTATYDESKTVTIEGELVQFLFRNSHAFGHVTEIIECACTDNSNDLYDDHLQSGSLDGSGRDESAIATAPLPRQ